MGHLLRAGEIVFLGTGEAFDAGTPNAAVLCRLGATILVDCGLTVPPHLWRMLADPDALDAIYLTHFHADHTFGVPSTLFRFREDGRRHTLTIIGQRGVERYVREMLRLAYRLTPTDFPFPLRFLNARPGHAFNFQGVRLSFARSRHSVVNLSVRLDWKGKSIAISGDGSPTVATERLFRDCGVLVHETFQDKVFEPVHASLPVVVDMARRANVKRLYLIHLSRQFRRRAPAKVAACVPSGMRIRIASCGEHVRI